MHSLTLVVPSSSVQNSTGPSPSRRGFVFVALALVLAWFTLSPAARAQEGDLGNHNTAEGAFALNYLTTGSDNTATGYFALFSNTTGDNNTATGNGALHSNTTGAYNTATGHYALQVATADDNTATGALALKPILPASIIRPPV